MTIQCLERLVKLIDNHFGKQRTKDERAADLAIYATAFKDVPDELAERALYNAFAVCRYQPQLIVDWNMAIREIQVKGKPSVAEMWLQAKRTAKKISDNTYYARTGGIILAPGKKKTPMELYRENEELFHALPKPIQTWAGSADMLADCVLRSDAEQFIKPGFEKAMREARLTATIGQLGGGSATMALNE